MSGYERKNTTGNSITNTKRKRYSNSEPSENVYEKSNRQESIAPKPHRSFAPGSSQRNCKPVRPSKSSLRRRRRAKDKISTSIEREWVFSTNNFENLKGSCIAITTELEHIAYLMYDKFDILCLNHLFSILQIN